VSDHNLSLRSDSVYAVTLSSGQWAIIPNTLDNETNTDDVEGDPRGVVEPGTRVIQAIRRHASGADRRPLPNDQMITIELPAPQCQLVANALGYWTAIAEEETDPGPGFEHEAAQGREVLRAFRAQLDGEA
jgi:hypothetical protein